MSSFSSCAAVLLGSALLVACHKSAPAARAVYLGPTPVYQLADGTRELTPDAASTAFYERRFNFHPQYNQPLHRIVGGGGSTDKVYLGLVLPPLPPDLATLTESDSVWRLVERRSLPGGAVVARLQSRRGQESNVRYVGASTKSRNTHVINLLAADSVGAQQAYRAEKLFGGNLLL